MRPTLSLALAILLVTVSHAVDAQISASINEDQTEFTLTNDTFSVVFVELSYEGQSVGVGLSPGETLTVPFPPTTNTGYITVSWYSPELEACNVFWVLFPPLVPEVIIFYGSEFEGDMFYWIPFECGDG